MQPPAGLDAGGLGAGWGAGWATGCGAGWGGRSGRDRHRLGRAAAGEQNDGGDNGKHSAHHATSFGASTCAVAPEGGGSSKLVTQPPRHAEVTVRTDHRGMAYPFGRQAAIVSYRLGAADGVSVTAGQ